MDIVKIVVVQDWNLHFYEALVLPCGFIVLFAVASICKVTPNLIGSKRSLIVDNFIMLACLRTLLRAGDLCVFIRPRSVDREILLMCRQGLGTKMKIFTFH